MYIIQARELLEKAKHTLHMCNGVFVPGNDGANKEIAKLCQDIDDFLKDKDKEIINKLRTQNAELKIKLEMAGIEG